MSQADLACYHRLFLPGIYLTDWFGLESRRAPMLCINCGGVFTKYMGVSSTKARTSTRRRWKEHGLSCFCGRLHMAKMRWKSFQRWIDLLEKRSHSTRPARRFECDSEAQAKTKIQRKSTSKRKGKRTEKEGRWNGPGGRGRLRRQGCRRGPRGAGAGRRRHLGSTEWRRRKHWLTRPRFQNHWLTRPGVPSWLTRPWVAEFLTACERE